MAQALDRGQASSFFVPGFQKARKDFLIDRAELKTEGFGAQVLPEEASGHQDDQPSRRNRQIAAGNGQRQIAAQGISQYKPQTQRQKKAEETAEKRKMKKGNRV